MIHHVEVVHVMGHQNGCRMDFLIQDNFNDVEILMHNLKTVFKDDCKITLLPAQIKASIKIGKTVDGAPVLSV